MYIDAPFSPCEKTMSPALNDFSVRRLASASRSSSASPWKRDICARSSEGSIRPMVTRYPQEALHTLMAGSVHAAAAGPALSQASEQVAGSAHRTRQWPPGQSTLQAPVHVMSQRAAPSQCTRLASPTVAVQVPFTYWHATVLALPQVALQVWAFWHDALHASP